MSMNKDHRLSSEWRRYPMSYVKDDKTLEEMKQKELEDAEREAKELNQMSDEDKKAEAGARHLVEKMQSSLKNG
jgi:hypothetical protein